MQPFPFLETLTVLVLVALALATYLFMAAEAVNALRRLRITRSLAGIGLGLAVVFGLAGMASFFGGPYTFVIPLVIFMLFGPPVRLLLLLIKDRNDLNGFLYCYGMVLGLLTLVIVYVLWAMVVFGL